MRHVALGIAAVLLAACDPAVPPVVPPDPVSRTYVLSTMDLRLLDETFVPASSHGLDLDGLIGGDPALPCTDAVDLVAADGSLGIDNQFGVLVLPALEPLYPEGVDIAVRQAIQSDAPALIIEVTGIDSFDDDPEVTVRIVLAYSPGGRPPLRSADMLGLAADQVFAPMTELGTSTAHIAGGRLEATASTLPIPTLHFGPIHDVALSADISDTHTLAHGELGGTVLVSDVTNWCPFIECPPLEAVESMFQPDLRPDETGEHCGGISLGAGFEAVGAILQ